MTKDELLEHLQYCTGDTKICVLINKQSVSITEILHVNSKDYLLLIPEKLRVK